MTEPDGLDLDSRSFAGTSTEELPASGRLCPYLLADGGWRAAAPAREHRCTALRPPTRLASDKQRRLCLTAGHTACPTFLAAVEERARQAAPGGPLVGRPIARTAPVVLERSRSLPSFESSPGGRRWGQLGLVLLMLVALVVARSGDDGGPAAGGVESVMSSPRATQGAGATVTSGPTPGTTPGQEGASGSPAAPTATSTATPRPAVASPPASPPAASAGARYTVKRGDTLTSIAVRFGTTVAAIQELNGIANPSLIRVGEVLEIP